MDCTLCKIQFVGKVATLINVRLNNHQITINSPKTGVVLVSLLLTLNIFHTLFQCLYSLLWTTKCRLGYQFARLFRKHGHDFIKRAKVKLEQVTDTLNRNEDMENLKVNITIKSNVNILDCKPRFNCFERS